MAPPSSSARKTISGTPRSVKSQLRQRTLDMFLSRGTSSLPAASAPTAPPKKTSSAQPALSTSRSNFAVILRSSPAKHPETALARTVDDDADDLMIMSDLTPQFRRLAAQASSGVSLAKPVVPAAVVAVDEAEATSSGATPQPQPKKRGRPKGYRPSLAMKASQDDDSEPGRRKLRPDRPKAGSMYAGKGKRRGRPPKQASPKPREIYENLNPHFNTWICEWQACRAELHNFATLRRHIGVVHLKNIPFQCRWGKCAAQQSPHEFPTSADLESHLEDRHMPPIAWQAGDGPQVSLKLYAPDDGTELPDYLFDKAGNQITPSIRDQKEEDFLTWRANRRKLKDLLLQRDQNLPSEEADEGMEVVESG
ncbi:hypothetical protein CMUS01_06656 [Colletotrichum musicola]|uniref:C2H2-type domain-containing protein n=1 Tax=Colletotrichum musicola TaxID=2175873 RepID=A0A8H6KKW1_9PEZI|nr:hypothetical protein CMUS01_06656 [Colletotrichum musicola]